MKKFMIFQTICSLEKVCWKTDIYSRELGHGVSEIQHGCVAETIEGEENENKLQCVSSRLRINIYLELRII